MPGKTALSFQPVKNRLVLFFPGFEPLGPEAHQRRFARAATKTGPHYGTSFDCGTLQVRPSGLSGFTVNAIGSEWETSSDIAIFDWSSILEHYERRPFPIRLFSGFAALLSLMFNGTLRRYLAVSWRYGFFFFYPVVLLIGCALAGWIAAGTIGLLMESLPAKWLTGLAVSTSFAVLAARKAHLLLMMDDWAFAKNLANRSDPAIEAKRKAFRASLVSEIEAGQHDEVLVTGHSLGCVFAIDALAGIGPTAKTQPSLLTVGSSLMKIALHPRAGWLVSSIASLTSTGTKWLDVQALTDVISFFRSNPAGSVGIRGKLQPKTLAIRFKFMLSPQSYRRGKYNLFRTHRQFVLAAEKPYLYSMHMIAAGPVPFDSVWAESGLPLGSGLFKQNPETGQ